MNELRDRVRVRAFRAGDLLIIAALLGGIFFVWPLINSVAPEEVVVYRDNRVIAQYPLTTDMNFFITGDNGPLEIGIEEKKVRINSVTCPHQICRRAGAIYRSKEQLVCVPNRILIEIRSKGEQEGFDALTY